MKDEADPRRRAILSVVAATGVTGVIYDAARRYKTERAACLGALIADAAEMADPIVVLEQDDSLLSWDRQRLIEFTREHGCQDTVRYQHRRAAEETLLAIPDALAWCWAKGQGFRLAAPDHTDDLAGQRCYQWPETREARAPRSSGRVSGSLPEAQRNRHRQYSHP